MNIINNRIENIVNVNFKQTASLTEFRTEVNEKLDDMKYDIKFLNKKEIKKEKDIFKIKKKVK